MVGWSPDGKWLLFSSDRTGATDLWAVPFDDGPLLGSPQLLKASFERTTPLGVTPSGTLYYAQVKGGSPSRIQIASMDLTTGKLSPPVELSQSYLDSDATPKWSVDGERLAYLSERGSRGAKSYVLVIRSNKSGPVRELRALIPNLSSVTLDSWAPGGGSLLVNGRDQKGRWTFYLVDVESGEAKALAGFDQIYNNAGWAPDGRSFLIEVRGSKPGLYRVDAGNGDASEVMEIPPGQGNFGLYPKWAPDGRSFYSHRIFKTTAWIFFDSGIVERDLVSGAEKQLIRRSSFVGPPQLTPDGRYVAVDIADPASNSRIVMLVPTAGGEPRELMRMNSETKPETVNNFNLGQWPFLAWISPDSRSLLVLRRLGDSTTSLIGGKVPSEFWLVPLHDGEPRKIGNSPAGFDLGIGMAVSPDGRHVAYSVTDSASQTTTELWALENFLPKPLSGR